MQATVTLANSSEFNLNNEEVFLRGIPSSINVGALSTEALRLLVFYVSKAGPYQLAVDSGFFTGTLEEWLTSLYGTGEGAGIQGPAGSNGTDGKSAYELFTDTFGEGEVPTLEEWLESLKGEAGEKGQDGIDGIDGVDGKSAYQLFVETLGEDDPIPTPSEWLASLVGATGAKGDQGDTGETGPKGDTGEPGPKGDTGDAGEPGPQGPKGEDGVDGIDGVTQDATTILLTGLSLDDATPTTETDTLLAVIGKLQAQINALTARIETLETA